LNIQYRHEVYSTKKEIDMPVQWIKGLLPALLISGCLTAGHPEANWDTDLSSASQAVMTVHGLSCPLCSNNLDGQLRRIEGVTDAMIDLETGAVRITLAPGHAIRATDLATAVKDAGFTLKSLRIAP